MSTEAPLVTPTDKTVLYLSRRSALRLTMKSRYPIRNPVSGQIDSYTPGAWIGFRDGQVRIPKSGKVQMQDTLDGGMSDKMDAKDVHEWLENHRLFENREEGFWRVDPEAPPVSEHELGVLMEAALNLDVDTLQRILVEEREGWGRDAILSKTEEALERATQLRAQMEEAQTQAQEEPPAEPEPPRAKPGPKPKASGG